jgi:hypothetical protein
MRKQQPKPATAEKCFSGIFERAADVESFPPLRFTGKPPTPEETAARNRAGKAVDDMLVWGKEK